MKSLVLISSAGLVIAYPFGIYWGLQNLSPRWLAAGLMVIVGLRFAVARRTAMGPFVPLIAPLVILTVSCSFALLRNDGTLLLYTPSLISLSLLWVFVVSLIHPPSLVERLARMWIPNLPARAVRYCRRATWVWCGFFLINGCISLWTAYAQSMSAWLIYNGFVSYLAVGAILVIDLAIHRSMVSKFQRRTLSDRALTQPVDSRSQRTADAR